MFGLWRCAVWRGHDDAKNESNLYVMDRRGADGLFVHCLVDGKRLRVGYEFLREPRPVEVGLVRFILDPARIAGYAGAAARDVGWEGRD